MTAVFESKVLLKMFGPVLVDNDFCIRSSNEQNELLNDIVLGGVVTFSGCFGSTMSFEWGKEALTSIGVTKRQRPLEYSRRKTVNRVVNGQ